MIAEPDVAFTDYALAVESFLFGFWVNRAQPSNSAKSWFVVLFVSIGLAALVGGTVHGFLTDSQSPAARFCWLVTMIFLGITAFAEYGIGARLMLSPQLGNLLIVVAMMIFVTYLTTILLWNTTFRIAVIDYLSGLIFVLIAFVQMYFRYRSRSALAGVMGLLLTVGASAVQQAHISIDRRYFNHNALYHLLEAIALLLIYRAARSAVNITTSCENR